jgi:hypothetical protein
MCRLRTALTEGPELGKPDVAYTSAILLYYTNPTLHQSKAVEQ